jgi:fused signal recognition particle receptor
MAGFFRKLIDRFRTEKIDWEELEQALVQADLGIRTTIEIIEELKARPGKISPDDLAEVCRSHIAACLPPAPAPPAPLPDRPCVILVVGVNGTGKTTSSAKLAHYLQRQGHSVMLAAADTFRAAAIEQLDAWASRLAIPIVKGAYQSDPSSVCFDAYRKAAAANSDFLICDTAGRLHTRHNLMEELKKIGRTLGKLDPSSPHHSWIVVDATTGTNALSQAREFHRALGLDGLIVTKLDGSGKGGVLVPIHRELGLVPRFLGTGESPEAIEPFDPDHFVSAIL